MLRRFSLDFAIFSIALDAALIATALAIATSFRPALSNLAFVKLIPGPIRLPWLVYLSFPVVWTGMLYLFSVYDGRRNLRAWREIASLSAGSLLATVVLAGILYLTFRETSRFLFISFALLAYTLILAWRILYRLFFRLGVIQGAQPRRVVIVGSEPASLEIAKHVQSYQKLGLTLVGWIGDEPCASPSPYEIIGGLSDAPEIIRELQIDDVVISSSVKDDESLMLLITRLSLLPVRIWVIPDTFEPALFKTRIDEFAGIPMLDLRAPGLTESQRLVKRSFDLIVTLLLSPLYLPLMGVIAVLIQRDSPGPVIFRQRRAGENGRIFTLYKFRSMVENAEDLRHLVQQADAQGRRIHKSQHDPRVTRIGKTLRRTSLDELPQLFNVLRGEMSLVGPRPELPEVVAQYQPWQHKRFSVPPGMTGWWQIHGRSDRPLHLNTQDDLYYIDNYSIFLDISILLRTIAAVWRRKGAY